MANLNSFFSSSIFSFVCVFWGRVLASLGAVALSVAIARVAGAEALGQFTFALTVATVISTLARSGLDTALLKTIAKNVAKGDSKFIPGNLRDAVLTTTLWSISLSVPLALAVFFRWPEGIATASMSWFVWLVLPLTLLTIGANYMRGVKWVAIGSMVDVGGLSFIAAIVFSILYFLDLRLNVEEIARIFLFVSVVSAGVLTLWIWKDSSRRADGVQTISSAQQRRELRDGRWYLMLSALAAFVTQAGSFALVGSILSEGDLGLARAAERLALMVSFPLTVVNPFIAPRIVYHVTFVDKNSLRILMSKACLASVLPALPVALTLLFIPHTFLSLFGPNFGDAALPLQVFAVAQLFTAATAPFAQLLYVGGNERALAHILIASMLVGMLLFPIATIYFGLFGFAAAYATINVVKAAFIVLYTVQLKAV